VRDVLARAEENRPPSARAGRPRPSQLDPHRVYVRTLLERHPGLPARQVWRLLKSERAFQGGETIVKRCVADLRPTQARAYFSLTFAPGESAQADWGACKAIDVAGTVRRVSFFVMVLAYSRLLYAELFLAEAMEHWLAAHRRAFEFFGGVPANVRVDRCRTAVCGLDGSGKPIITPGYQAFARHYRFKVDACHAHCPNEKGRVESGVAYLKSAFFAGREPTPFLALQEALRDWVVNEANVRIHGATGKRPAEMFAAAEKAALHALPPTPYECCVEKQTNADSRFRVTVDTNRYSVPAEFASRHVTLRRYADRIVVLNPADGRLLADHPRSYARKQDIAIPEHERSLILRTRHGADRRLLSTFLTLGPAAEPYLAGLQERRPDWRSHLRQINALAEVHGRDQAARALADALEHRAFAADCILALLRTRRNIQGEPGPLHVTRRQDLLDLTVPEPDLTIYQRCTDNHDDSKDKETKA
jgi:transposase